MEIVVGGNKRARRSYGFDEVALVPGPLVVDPRDVDVSWELGGRRFEIPILASALDAAVNPALAVAMSKLGGLAVLNLDGVQARYEDAEAVLARIAEALQDGVIGLIQKLYEEPVKPELVARRVREIKEGGGVAAVSAAPHSAERAARAAVEAGADFFFVQSTVGSVRFHSTHIEAFPVAEFCRNAPIPVIVGNTVGYQATLELMEAGAAGVLVGVGPGHICTSRKVLGIGVPQITATADCAAARDEYHARTGRYVPVITDGGLRVGGDIAKAIAAGADAVMLGSTIAAAREAPAPGYSWGMAAPSADLPRGTRIKVGVSGTLREILFGPAHRDDGTMNLVGALKLSMGSLGAKNVREMQQAEMMVAPSLPTEGKSLQRSQGVG
uniref:Inosine-5'-monophosphate dehydrogenase, catalytic domain n=1 Tax=uncultured Armatimonadetes bacterium TaxID=157466 RepID=A0A6J4HXM7_9BACT|nr:Inosine-5'-monophosphate dehydrogenase, catalytic domain [uncultured Armatimonadetes bacterium]